MKSSMEYARNFFSLEDMKMEKKLIKTEYTETNNVIEKSIYITAGTRQYVIWEKYKEGYDEKSGKILIIGQDDLECNICNEEFLEEFLPIGFKIIGGEELISKEEQMMSFSEKGILYYEKKVVVLSYIMSYIKHTYGEKGMNVLGISGMACILLVCLENFDIHIDKMVCVNALVDYDLLLKNNKLEVLFGGMYYQFEFESPENTYKKYPELYWMNPVKLLLESRISKITELRTINQLFFEGEKDIVKRSIFYINENDYVESIKSKLL